MSELLGYFEEIPLEAGELASGRTEDGRRVVARVQSVAWWVPMAMAVSRWASRAACWALNRGVRIEGEWMEASE